MSISEQREQTQPVVTCSFNHLQMYIKHVFAKRVPNYITSLQIIKTYITNTILVHIKKHQQIIVMMIMMILTPEMHRNNKM